MKFSEREEILEQRQIRKEMYTRHLTRFAGTTAIAVILFLSHVFSDSKNTEIPQPSPSDHKISETLTTLEGREFIIDEKYDGAKIIAEKPYGKDIISVFEVGYMYSFCVFEAIENGYWMEYCGNLFPKTELVKGTVYLGDNTHEYDICLQYENIYSRLLVTQTNKKYPKHKEKQNISFDENGIGITKIDYHRTRYFKTQIEAFDAEGNKYLLDDGGLF